MKCQRRGMPPQGGAEIMEQTEATAIERTYLYLDNYNEMQRYIKEAVSEATQVEETDVYNISAERAFLKSIRECRTETIILFEHINKSLDALRKEAEAAGEGYKFDALWMHYIEGMSYEDIRKRHSCGKNAPKTWCKTMAERLAIKLFGAKAIENCKIPVKTP